MMNLKYRRFAPLGLYIALLGVIAAVSLYIIQREWNLYLQISLGVIVLGLALFAVLDPERVRTILTGRQARYGSNTIVMVIAFIGILVVVNYFAFKNSQRVDLTDDQSNTLAPETVDTLETLPEPVEAQAFFTNRVDPGTAEKLLENYLFAGKGKFTYRFIDPESDPVAAKDAKVTRDGMLVIKMGDRQEPVEFVTEKEVTSALVRLISNETKAVYFLTGHGERDPDGTGEDAYSLAKLVLESKNYKIEKLNLLSTNKIPEDAGILVVAGPIQPVSEPEVNLIQSFVEAGGSLIVMEEPLPLTNFGDQPDPLADYLEESWGIVLGKDLVVDPALQQLFIAVGTPPYASHPITEKMQGLAALFPSARTVGISEKPEGVNLTELVLTSDQAWGEADLESLEGGQSVQPDSGVDILGPAPLVVVGEKLGSSSRIVVFGDADFATDPNFTQYGNGDLLVNSIDWTAGQEELINLTPKDTVQRVLVPPKQYTIGLILFGFVFVVPGAVLISGVIVWVQRRKRG